MIVRSSCVSLFFFRFLLPVTASHDLDAFLDAVDGGGGHGHGGGADDEDAEMAAAMVSAGARRTRKLKFYFSPFFSYCFT
jgi:hypothetical protein